MGIFDLFRGKTPKEEIWTLDFYIEKICSSRPDQAGNKEEMNKYLRRLGEEIASTYGITGIKHAWRAASVSGNREALCNVLGREWKGLAGWEP
ncbi:MAG: hypothetical protein ACYTHM_25605 [Planctomycetota bacterium]|jgi:hypothetical protein